MTIDDNQDTTNVDWSGFISPPPNGDDPVDQINQLVVPTPEENRVSYAGVRNLLQEEMATGANRLREEGEWGQKEVNEFLDLATRIIDGQEVKEEELRSMTGNCPLSLGKEVVNLRTIYHYGRSFRGYIKSAEALSDLETGPEESGMGSTFNFVDDGTALALGYVARVQGGEFKKRVDERIRSNRFIKKGFSDVMFSNLMLYDQEIGLEYYLRENTHSWKDRGLLWLRAIGDNRLLAALPVEEKQMCSILDGSGKMSVRVFDYMVRWFNTNQVAFPLPKVIGRRFEELATDRRVLKELARNRSPYVDYLASILLSEEGLEVLERLRSVIVRSDIGFLMAMQARVVTQEDIVREVNLVIDRHGGGERESPVSLELMLQRLEKIYNESGEHRGETTVARRFRGMGQEVGQYVARGNVAEALDSIFKTGCFAQEMLPYIPFVNNFLPGHLNGLARKGTPEDVLNWAINNGTFRNYMSGEGQNVSGIILIFSPNTESKANTVYGYDKTDDGMPRTQSLTLVGISTQELAAIVLGEGVDLEKVEEMMVACEKYVPVYDAGGNLVFTSDRFRELVERKPYTVENFVKSPPIESLKKRLSGHGGDSLFDHTVRVQQLVRKYYPGADLGEDKKLVIEVAAILHDYGKDEDGKEQGEANVMRAVELLGLVQGLSVRDKEMIRLAIFLDEVIGVEILANFNDEGANEQEVSRVRERIRGMFTDNESMRLALCLYIADVAGIDENEQMMKTFRVKEKLTKLGLWDFDSQVTSDTQ